MPLGVRDFVYDEDYNILFVACCDMNIVSRLDSYFSNVNLPWGSNNNNHVSVGAIFTFFLNKEKGKDYILEKKFAKSYPQQTGVINFDIDKNIIINDLHQIIDILEKSDDLRAVLSNSSVNFGKKKDVDNYVLKGQKTYYDYYIGLYEGTPYALVMTSEQKEDDFYEYYKEQSPVLRCICE